MSETFGHVVNVDAINKALTHNVVGSRLCGESRPRTALTELVHKGGGGEPCYNNYTVLGNTCRLRALCLPNSDGLHNISTLKPITWYLHALI